MTEKRKWLTYAELRPMIVFVVEGRGPHKITKIDISNDGKGLVFTYKGVTYRALSAQFAYYPNYWDAYAALRRGKSGYDEYWDAYAALRRGKSRYDEYIEWSKESLGHD